VLPGCGVQYCIEQILFDFERGGEIFGDQRRRRAGRQQFRKRPMPSAEIGIAEPTHEAAAAQPQRPCPLQDEPADRVLVLSKTRLNRWRIHRHSAQ
jgi:hypothetical protein